MVSLFNSFFISSSFFIPFSIKYFFVSKKFKTISYNFIYSLPSKLNIIEIYLLIKTYKGKTKPCSKYFTIRFLFAFLLFIIISPKFLNS